MTTQSLCFNEVTLTPIPYNNEPWIKSTELAKALGYAREDAVARIYERNADEFDGSMTQLIEISEDRQFGSGGMMRVFSLRGCHLIAMFARTPVAKAFRKWMLDVLDKLTVRVALPAAKAKKPAQKALPKAEQKALPAPKLTIEEDIALFAEEVRLAHAQTYAHRTHLMARAGKIMSALAERLRSKARYSDYGKISILASYLLSYVHEVCIEALHYPGEHLDSYFSPEKLLMDYAKLEKDW